MRFRHGERSTAERSGHCVSTLLRHASIDLIKDGLPLRWKQRRNFRGFIQSERDKSLARQSQAPCYDALSTSIRRFAKGGLWQGRDCLG